MKTRTALLVLSLMAGLSTAIPVQSQEPPPAWAFPVNPPDFKPAPDDGTPRRVPGSTATYTLTHVRDLFVAPVWHPADHPPRPEVVSHGRKPDVQACGVCHRADGPGGPENSSVAGLPAARRMPERPAGEPGKDADGLRLGGMPIGVIRVLVMSYWRPERATLISIRLSLH